ncbi:uncharacterized protein BDZ99DRAFT_576348 [Mytilinidion resinicola]|uniref:Uncharacterized protein n=1 Tax=Mytilinidion resinicola TaxID=574789 RepID=A0A6A6Y4Y3_9PEZI|nr:uncharacterized protein BDZ99DRAFT_576348 [Mytilinidion resinicola]KAF2803084.1 hypothetical protein BDZ99DRAFT_576348 [Mytilinidion resinicola]
MDMAKLREGKKDGWSPTQNPHEFGKIADDELQCFMRMRKICYALTHEKTIFAEVLSGGFGDRLVRQFVNVPIEWRGKKGNNRQGNDGKAEKSIKRAEKCIEQKHATEAAKNLAATAGQEANTVNADVTSTAKKASNASNARASKKLELLMNGVVREAFVLGIMILDLYIGLLVDEEEEDEEQNIRRIPQRPIYRLIQAFPAN